MVDYIEHSFRTYCILLNETLQKGKLIQISFSNSFSVPKEKYPIKYGEKKKYQTFFLKILEGSSE